MKSKMSLLKPRSNLYVVVEKRGSYEFKNRIKVIKVGDQLRVRCDCRIFSLIYDCRHTAYVRSTDPAKYVLNEPRNDLDVPEWFGSRQEEIKKIIKETTY